MKLLSITNNFTTKLLSENTSFSMQETLENYGWSVLTGLDVSRKDHDKSIITLTKSVPKSVPFACIALSDVDKIRIIDFPAYEQERLAEVIRSTYAYGIQLEKPIDEKCLQFKLQVTKLFLIKV